VWCLPCRPVGASPVAARSARAFGLRFQPWRGGGRPDTSGGPCDIPRRRTTNDRSSPVQHHPPDIEPPRWSGGLRSAFNVGRPRLARHLERDRLWVRAELVPHEGYLVADAR